MAMHFGMYFTHKNHHSHNGSGGGYTNLPKLALRRSIGPWQLAVRGVGAVNFPEKVVR